MKHLSTIGFVCRWAETTTNRTSLVSIPQVFNFPYRGEIQQNEDFLFKFNKSDDIFDWSVSE